MNPNLKKKIKIRFPPRDLYYNPICGGQPKSEVKWEVASTASTEISKLENKIAFPSKNILLHIQNQSKMSQIICYIFSNDTADLLFLGELL